MPTLTMPLGGYRDDYKYYGTSSSYPLSNAVGSTAAGGTKYAGINLTRNSNAESYVYMTFDLSEIPSNATITSVSANVRMYGSTTAANRTSTRTVQLYSGNNTKGSAVDFECSGSATIYSMEYNNWTRAELDDLAIKVYIVRNSSNTTSNTYIYWLGADVTVEYEEAVPLVYHTVTINAAEGVSTEPELGNNNAAEGQPYPISIHGVISSITDNGDDVFSQLVEKRVEASGSVTQYPAAYTTSGSISGTRYQNCIGKDSSTTATGNDYASSSSSTATIYYTFDFSSIPENATINSVTVKVGGHAESTSNSSRKSECQLYSGNTTKGSASSFTSTSKQVLTLSAGTWTRAELQEAKLAFTIGYYGGLVNGVDFIVDYTIPATDAEVYYIYTIPSVFEEHIILINMATETETGYFFKENGHWIKIKKMYKKNNGSWIEIQLDQFLDRTIKYIHKTI